MTASLGAGRGDASLTSYGTTSRSSSVNSTPFMASAARTAMALDSSMTAPASSRILMERS